MSDFYKAITITRYGDLNSICINEVPFPDIPVNHVLIKTEFATLHPVDEYIASGGLPLHYLYDTLGYQGSGIVVKSGGGAYANSLLNKRVSFLNFEGKCTGAWGEFSLSNSLYVAPIWDSLNFEQAALLFYVTIVEYMIHKIKKGRHRAVILNAGASYVGKCLIKRCVLLGIPTISIVRSQEQVKILESIGAEYVVNSSDENWKETVKDLAKLLNATVGFDAVAGEMTGDLYSLLRQPGVLYVYGVLSEQPSSINTQKFRKNKRIKGLTIDNWFQSMSVFKKHKLFENIQKIWNEVYHIDYHQTVDLNGVKEAVKSYVSKKTNSKILIRTRG